MAVVGDDIDIEDLVDGEYADEGVASIGWAVRAFKVDGTVQYDWVYDRPDGGYVESDEYFDSIEDAKADLGVD